MEIVQRRYYSGDFKKGVAQLASGSEYNGAEVARNRGVNYNNVVRWNKQYGSESSLRKVEESEALRCLRAENRQLKMERDILKKAAAYFARESQSAILGSGSKVSSIRWL